LKFFRPLRIKSVVSGTNLWQLSRVKTVVGKPASSNGVQAEVRQLRATGKRIAANRKSVLRFLAATGMYTATGKLKRRFR
jgi:hypothetical protein